MNLPAIVLRAPRLIYGLAVLFLIWSFALSYFELRMTMIYANPQDAVVRLTMLRGLFQAALEGTYIALNGVIVHVLLAIWHNGHVETPGADE